MDPLGHDFSREEQGGEGRGCSRRGLLKGSAAFVLGGGAGVGVSNLSACSPPPVPGAPPLPWKWVELDPLEAGRRAYRLYFDPVRGGCGSGSYSSILSLL